MRKTVLVAAIPLAVAAPAAGQMSLGVRAGIGGAWMDNPLYSRSGPCRADCPDAARLHVDGQTFGADLDIVKGIAADSMAVLSVRVGAAYIEKGGMGYGSDGDGEPRWALATSYLQFSALLRARIFKTSGRALSVVLLAGPWVGAQLSCEKEGRLAANCEAIDFGYAMGGGVELALPGPSRASVALEWMIYDGLREHSKYHETTIYSGIQLGFVHRIG